MLDSYKMSWSVHDMQTFTKVLICNNKLEIYITDHHMNKKKPSDSDRGGKYVIKPDF